MTQNILGHNTLARIDELEKQITAIRDLRWFMEDNMSKSALVKKAIAKLKFHQTRREKQLSKLINPTEQHKT